MHEVQKYVVATNHGYLGYALITNKKFWDSLPADVRGQLDKAVKEATDHANKIAKQKNDEDLEAVRKSGKSQVVVASPQLRTALKKALVPVHLKMDDRVGIDLVKSIYQQTGFDPAKL
jgi:C4-dicarboxylate-binding protein DctP